MKNKLPVKILAILRRNDANFVEKLLTRVVNLEKTMHKKQPTPTPTKAKG